jgi:hypothetical protein
MKLKERESKGKGKGNKQRRNVWEKEKEDCVFRVCRDNGIL